MKPFRCMSCGFANRRVVLTDDQRPVYHNFTIYESSSGKLRYCGNCLIHAQIVLTELLGSAMVYQMLNSGQNNRLKEFGTPMTWPNRILWALDYNRRHASDGNVE